MPNLGKWPQGCLALLDNAVNAVHCFVLTDKQRISFALAALKMRQAKLLRLGSNIDSKSSNNSFIWDFVLTWNENPKINILFNIVEIFQKMQNMWD